MANGGVKGRQTTSTKVIDAQLKMNAFEKSVALYEQLVAAQQTGVKIKATGVFYNPESSFVSLLNPDLRADIL